MECSTTNAREPSSTHGENRKSTSFRQRVVIVLGEGGHATELLQLIDLLGPVYDYHYLLTKEDTQSAAKIRVLGPVHRITRPRHAPGRRYNLVRDAWLSLRCF